MNEQLTDILAMAEALKNQINQLHAKAAAGDDVNSKYVHQNMRNAGNMNDETLMFIQRAIREITQKEVAVPASIMMSDSTGNDPDDEGTD